MRCVAAARIAAADRCAALKHKQATMRARFEHQNVGFELLTLKNIKNIMEIYIYFNI